ncbi:MAG: hypothetical protein JJU45_08055 [Acidimicrobiia bacterium]|nr:hypothetical protein [Acidimicrobiia bacterium]
MTTDDFGDIGPADIKVTRRAGLAELAVDGRLGPDAENITQQLKALAATPGLVDTRLAAEIRGGLDNTFALLADGQTGFWDQLHKMFEPRWDRLVNETEVPLEIGVFYLNLPGVAGVSAKLSSRISAAHTYSASVELGVLGGGPSHTMTLTRGFERLSDTPEVFQITVPAVVESREIMGGSDRGKVYLRLGKIKDEARTFSSKRLQLPDPKRLGPEVERLAVDLSNSGGTFTETQKIQESTTWEATVDFKIGGLGLELGTKGTYGTEVGIDYTVAGGHKYVGVRYQRLPVTYWTP